MAKRHTKPRTSAKAVSQPERTTPVETPQAAARDVTDGLPSIDSAAAIALAGKAYDAVDAAFQTARKRHDAELADAIREFQGFAEQWQQDLEAPTKAKIAAEAIVEREHSQRIASGQHSGAILMRASESDFAVMRDETDFEGPLAPTPTEIAIAQEQLARTGHRKKLSTAALHSIEPPKCEVDRPRVPIAERNETFRQWKAHDGLGLAAIRDRWNLKHPQQHIGDGETGRDLVKKGIASAQKLLDATKKL